MNCGACCSVNDSLEENIGGPSVKAPGLTVDSDLAETPAAPAATTEAPAQEVVAPPPPAPPAPPPAPSLPAAVAAEVSTVTQPATAPAIKAFPPPKARMMKATISKAGKTELGIDVDYGSGKVLSIVRVKAGLIEAWNTAQPARTIGVQDTIHRVNGKGDSTDAILEQVQKASTLELDVEKYGQLEYSVTLYKRTDDEPIGLDIDSSIVKVLVVRAGPIQSFNESLLESQSEYRIKIGDQVTSVNGLDDVTGMIDQLKSKMRLEIKFARETADPAP